MLRLVKCQKLFLYHNNNNSVRFISKRFFSSSSFMEQLVINGARWEDGNYYHRLGFHEEVKDISRIKEHYRILAKHYHPDNPNAPPNATSAFQNITEAYEQVTANAKDTSDSKSYNNNNNSEEDFNTKSGFRFTDHERRVQQMRFLGEGVALFMVMTFIFIFIVSRHNKERMQARYLGHFLIIFFTIQFFPRLLAAAILFACHANYLINLSEAKEQASTSVILEKRKNDISIHLNGITEEIKPNVILQVTTKTNLNNQNLSQKQIPKQEKEKTSGISTTLTFDAGVTSVIVPILTQTPMEFHIKAIDEKRKFIVADHTIQL